MKNKKFMKKLLPLFILIFACAADVSAQNQRYVSTDFGIAFQIPQNSSKLEGSNPKEVDFEENREPGGYFNFTVDDQLATAELSRILLNMNKTALVDGFIKGLKGELKEAKITLLEKLETKISGYSSYKTTISIGYPNIKMRLATFFIPVPEHNRVYTFTIAALNSDFERCRKIAEPFVNSLKILKLKDNQLAIR